MTDKEEIAKLRGRNTGRKGLGVAPYCLPEKSLTDRVTHGEMQEELGRLRAAITLLASRLGNELGSNDARRILELVAPPAEREVSR